MSATDEVFAAAAATDSLALNTLKKSPLERGVMYMWPQPRGIRVKAQLFAGWSITLVWSEARTIRHFPVVFKYSSRYTTPQGHCARAEIGA